MKVPRLKHSAMWIAAAALFALISLLIATGFGLPRAAPLPLQAGDRHVTAAGLQWRIRESGSDRPGPPIVLLHGFGSSLDEWRSVMDALPDRRCIAVDLPGFGGSDRAPESFDLDAQSSRLIALLDSLGIDRVALAGRSMGGSIAAWTAAHHPARVTALALLAPSGVPGSMRHTFPLGFVYRAGLLNRIFSVVAHTRLFYTLFPDSLARQVLTVTASYGEQFEAVLPLIDQKTLLIWSRTDHRTPFQYHEVYLRLIRNCELVEAPEDAGHSVSLRFADDTARLLDTLVRTAADSG